MELSFQPFNYKTGLKKQRELFLECFPENINTTVASEEHYYWKFHSKKSVPQSVEYIAIDKSDYLGYYAGIPYNYRYENTTIKAAMVCDVMTGVKARGKGIFTKLGKYSTDQMAQSGFDITTGYPIRPEVIPGHLKAGWEQKFALPLYGRFISFKTILSNKKMGFLAPFLNLIWNLLLKLAAIFNSKEKIGYTTNVYSSIELDQIDGLEDFINEWGQEIPINLIKNKDFLAWRLGAPDRKYSIITLQFKDKLVGLIIARKIIKEGVPCMGVLDIMILKQHYHNSQILLNRLIILSKAKNLELILVMISKYWHKRYRLNKSFFIKTPYNFYLIVKNLSKRFSDSVFNNEKNWHVMWIDSDDL